MSHTLNSQISALHSIGADAMDNLFDIEITIPTSSAAATPAAATASSTATIQDQFRLRCEGFEPPKFSQKKYEVRYKTVGMNRPASRIDGSREFSLTFRLDAYYTVYKALLDWRSILFEPSTGYATAALDPALGYTLGKIDVYTQILPPVRKANGSYDIPGVTYKSLSTLTGTAMADGVYELNPSDNSTIAVCAWSFFDVWISDLTEPKFTVGGGEIQKVTATFQFGEYRSPSSPETIST